VTRRLAAALLVALAATGAAAAGSRPAPAARLAALEARYDQHLMSERPDLASRLDRASADDRLAPVTEATLERDEHWLAAIADSLAAIPRASLRRSQAQRLDSLLARVEREAAPVRDGSWHRDPLLYLELTHGSVMRVARRPRVTDCERARRALMRLRAVPEILRSAEVNLREHAAFDRDTVLARWRVAMFDWRTELPRVAGPCRDPARYANLVEADTLALRAAERFLRFLAEDVRAVAP
jgi:hypothetical protein